MFTSSKAKPRLVLDTNTFISRLLVPSGVAARAVDKALDEGVLLASDESLGELADVLSRAKFDSYVSIQERQQFFKLLGGIVQIVRIHHRVTVCRDPKDDMLLQLALNGEAKMLITGDRDLLALAESFLASHKLRILTPSAYLSLSR